MSGRMDRERIERLYGKMMRKAERDGRTLEILFHPGITLPEEVTPEIAKEAAEDFISAGTGTRRKRRCLA